VTKRGESDVCREAAALLPTAALALASPAAALDSGWWIVVASYPTEGLTQMLKRVAIIALITASTPSLAVASDTPTLIRLWNKYNLGCRGGFGNDPRTYLACDKRESVSKALERRRCEYGQDHWECP